MYLRDCEGFRSGGTLDTWARKRRVYALKHMSEMKNVAQRDDTNGAEELSGLLLDLISGTGQD